MALSHQAAGLSPGNIYSPVWQPPLSSGRLLTPCLVSPAIFFWSVPTKPFHFPALSPFHFLFTFPGVRGAEKFSETGKIPQFLSSIPEGGGAVSVCHGQLSSLRGCQKLSQSRRGWFTINCYRKNSPLKKWVATGPGLQGLEPRSFLWGSGGSKSTLPSAGARGPHSPGRAPGAL